MRSTWTLLAFLLAGCGGGQAAAPAVTTGQAASPSQVALQFDPATHMRLTHHAALRMRDAVISGEIDEAHRAAAQLRSDLSEDLFPDYLLSYRDQLVQAVDELTDAGQMAGAASAVAAVAKECGDCHWYARKGPQAFRVDVRLPTQGQESLSARMVRHGVAAEQFWLGLVGPSEDMWREGSKTLASAPFAPPAVDESVPHGEALAAEAEALRDVAKAARLADSYEDRAEVYGHFLAACATCHHQAPR